MTCQEKVCNDTTNIYRYGKLCRSDKCGICQIFQQNRRLHLHAKFVCPHVTPCFRLELRCEYGTNSSLHDSDRLMQRSHCVSTWSFPETTRGLDLYFGNQLVSFSLNSLIV